MRRPTFAVLIALLFAVIALPAEARGRKRAPAPGSFQLESELISQIPEVATALEHARSHPTDAGAWRALGTELSRRGDHPDALRAFEIAVQIDRRDADAWVDLGAAYIRAGMIREAIDALRSALEIEPLHALGHYNLGLAYQERKHYDDAIREFKAALLLEPDLGDPVKNPAAAINPALPYVRLAVYLETTGATPALFSSENPAATNESSGNAE